MTHEGVVARYPAAALGSGMASGGFALGALALLWVAGTGGVPAVAVAVFFAVIWGTAMWALLRARTRAGRDDLSRVMGRPRGSDGMAWTAGALRAVFLGVALLIVSWVGASVLDEGVLAFLPGGLLGASIYTALDTRDLRRWQDDVGLELCTRVGAGPISWTNDQARRAFVAVPRRADPRT